MQNGYRLVSVLFNKLAEFSDLVEITLNDCLRVIGGKNDRKLLPFVRSFFDADELDLEVMILPTSPFGFLEVIQIEYPRFLSIKFTGSQF